MVHPSRKLLAFFLAVAAVLAAMALPARAAAGFQLTRVAGNDRYLTAAAAARGAFGAGADDAVLASGQNFPDALAGNYLAGRVDGPLLLTTAGDLPDATIDVIDDLNVDRVFVLGGTGAISEAAVNELPDDVEAVRVAGGDRYATAAEVSTQETGAAGTIGEVSGKTTALLASGESFADALAAGPVAFAGRFPTLLTTGGSLSPAASGAIDELNIEHVVIVGGTAAVSANVASQVAALGVTTQRVAGSDRYATATAVAGFGSSNVTGWAGDAVDLASGVAFPDALAGGAAAGNDPRALLLTDPTTLSPATKTYLESKSATLMSGRIFGGTGAVTTAVESAAEAAGAGGTEASGEVVSVDTTANTYRFVQNGIVTTAAYDDDDDFSVGGNDATIGGFEGAINPGDRIVYSDTEDSHALTNVEPASINNRTVGNVDLADDQFDFVNDTSGDWVRRNISYAGGAYQVDGQTADLAAFENAINEGDLLNITTSGSSTVFNLTQRTTTGTAEDITKNDVGQSASFQIGELGDIPGAGSDTQTDPPGQDDKYQANGAPGSTDVFSVDGATKPYADFAAALTDGDRVSYTRTGGVETFALTNLALATQEGQVTSTINRNGDNVPNNDTGDGGSFTIATADGTYAATYPSSTAFVVDGKTSSEAEFEAAVSAGDDVTFRPADAGAGQTARVELTNKLLEGRVTAVNTTDVPDQGGNPGNSYGVLARNGITKLAQIGYDADDVKVVDGETVTGDMAAWEAALNATGTKRMEYTPASGANQPRHELDT